MAKTYKYEPYLSELTNCPPTHYEQIKSNAFRWLHRSIDEPKNFMPVLVQSPRRALTMSHIQACKGFGLSLFDSFEGALNRYNELIKNKPQLVLTFGNAIGEIQLEPNDGVSSEPESNNHGHFTFHEFENVDLSKKIIKFVSLTI